jgi:hypothetical protein
MLLGVSPEEARHEDREGTVDGGGFMGFLSTVGGPRSRALGAAIVSALLTCVGAGGTIPLGAQAALPATLDSYLTSGARLSESDRQALRSGAPVATLLDADAPTEVAVFGAVWIEASPEEYVRRLQDIETFERGGGFRVTKRISIPPKIADFAALSLPEEDVADLRRCRVGDCEIKLGADALESLRAEVNWSGPTAKAQAEAVLRRLSVEYVTAYREGGNSRLAVYRDMERPTFVADEFRSMIDRLPALTERLPDLKRYLLEYPKAKLDGSTDFLYWQETQFGLKPTIRISHVTIQNRREGTVVASKMLYASHYFWTALELRVLLPDPARGSGFWFVTVNRSRSDGLTGFVGSLIRGRVGSEARDGTLAALTATKALLEGTPR